MRMPMADSVRVGFAAMPLAHAQFQLSPRARAVSAASQRGGSGAAFIDDIIYNNRAVRDEVNRVMANPEINGTPTKAKNTRGEK
jgi:hypothetical protein